MARSPDRVSSRTSTSAAETDQILQATAGRRQAIAVVALAVSALALLALRGGNDSPTVSGDYTPESSPPPTEAAEEAEPDADADTSTATESVDEEAPPPPDTPGEDALPEPIEPSSNVLGDILDDYRDGGLIVLPAGRYLVGDIDGLNPSNRLTVVAERRNEVEIVRTADEIGETDFWIKNSSNVTFAGIWFRDVSTVVSSSNDIEFRYTRHSYPIEAHPDPANTWCSRNSQPNGLEINGWSENIDLYGVSIDGIGNDGIKVVQSDDVDVVGTVITNINHGFLQKGNTNGDCSSIDGDNYHYDGIQFVNGSVDDFTLRDSYVGRRIVMQIDADGESNGNVTIDNVWLMAESTEQYPAEYDCVTMLMRVNRDAASGARQTVTTNDLRSFCDPSIDGDLHWTTGGNRSDSLIINGQAIPESQTNTNAQFDEIRFGRAEIAESPAAVWREANSYQSWLLEQLLG